MELFTIARIQDTSVRLPKLGSPTRAFGCSFRVLFVFY